MKMLLWSQIIFLYDMFRSAISGVEWFVILYVLCLVCFFVIGRQYLNLGFLYPFLFMLCTVFNPFFIVPFGDAIGLSSRIRRIFWLLPVNLVVAYAFAYLTTLPKKRLFRAGIALVLILFICLAGTSVKPYLQKPQNLYKTSNEIIEISNYIQQDAQENKKRPLCLYSSQQLLELRQYNPSIQSILRRNDLLDWNMKDETNEEEINKVLASGHHTHILAMVSRYGIKIDKEFFLRSAAKTGIQYIIASQDMEMADYYEEMGFEQFAQAGEYQLFHLK